MRYILFFIDPANQSYRATRLVEDPEKRIKSIKHGEHKYYLRDTKAFKMGAWWPERSSSWFAPLYDAIASKIPTWTFFFNEGESEPLDRVSLVRAETKINPRLVRVLTLSKLYNDYLRRLNYGGSVSTKTLLILMIALGALVAVMYFGGYL